MKWVDILIIPSIALLLTTAVSIYLYEPPGKHIPDSPAGLSLSGQSNELILAMSRFETAANEDGLQEYKAGDAQVWIVHPDEDWRTEVLANPESTVCHKGDIADLDNDGLNELWAAGGQNATLNVYRKAGGSWESETVWKPPFIRVRDIESGDVDGDGLPELVAVTHGSGVAAVIEWENGSWSITEVDRKDGIYIHEVELADVDNDGIDEFFSNPTEPNTGKGLSQKGELVMHKWNGTSYEKQLIHSFNSTHAKEIAVGDLDNDGYPELLASVSGVAMETNTSAQDVHDGLIEMEIETPLRIVMWDFQEDILYGEIISEINDIEARSLRIGDADNDGLNELVVGTDSRGLQIIKNAGGKWVREIIDKDLRGSIHEVMIIDVDGDGLNEIVASSDMMGLLNFYRKEGDGWSRETVLDNLEGFWIWAMDWGDADNE
jgi:hypothetical protein